MPHRLARRLTLLAALALPALALAPPVAGAERGPQRSTTAAAADDGTQARVIVKYREGASVLRPLAGGERLRPLRAAAMAQRTGLALRDGRVVAPRTQVLHARGIGSQALAERLARDPDVEYAEVDQRVRVKALVPNDPLYPNNLANTTPATGQWYLRAPDASALAAINAEGAWLTTQGSPSITVAVIDTGVRLDHPDLAGKLWPGYDFISDVATAADGNGRDADASDPGDWTNDGQCAANEAGTDSSWHGTQVAGLIGAATDNGLGMAGTGRNVMVLPVRALGPCGGFQSDIVAGMRWAAGLSSDPTVNPHPARVVNLSLGSSGACSATYQSAVSELTAAGVAVVVAAGNDTGLAANQPSNCAGAIGVAGIRHIGSKVGYSNIGPLLTVAAPAGNCVNLGNTEPCLYPLLTTTNSGRTSPAANTWSDSFNYSVGTSFATPLVAGTVALMISARPAIMPAQIQSLLRATARSFPTTGADAGTPTCVAPSRAEQDECYCTTSTCGAGMLDASNAVLRAANLVLPQVTVTASAAQVEAGSALTLDGSTSAATGGRSIASYAWRVVAGGNFADFSSGTTGPIATLAPRTAGDLVVALTVTDDLGGSSTGFTRVTVSGASDSGGGGALGWGWLAGLAAALLALRLTARADLRSSTRRP